MLQKNYSLYLPQTGETPIKSTYVVPYRINMEELFEFYIRILVRDNIPDKYEMVPFAEKIFLEKGVSDVKDVKKNVHLMAYCIPDIIIREKENSSNILAVIDVKYKDDERENRMDSFQLMAYALLTGASKCGFVFSGDKNDLM